VVPVVMLHGVEMPANQSLDRETPSCTQVAPCGSPCVRRLLHHPMHIQGLAESRVDRPVRRAEANSYKVVERLKRRGAGSLNTSGESPARGGWPILRWASIGKSDIRMQL